MLKQHKEMYGSDDWLAREIRRESRISAWDMDGGKIVREEHEENCDARNLAAQHALDCEAEDKSVTMRTGEAVLIPATLNDIRITPQGACQVLEIYLEE